MANNYFSDEQVKEIMNKNYELLGMLRIPKDAPNVIMYYKALMNLAVDTAKGEPTLIQWLDADFDEWVDTDERYYKKYEDDGNEIRKLYSIKELPNG